MKNLLDRKLILLLPRTLKILIIILSDIIFCFFSLWLALALRYEKIISFSLGMIETGIMLSIILIFTLLIFGSYKFLFRFSGIEVIKNLFISFLFYGFLVSIILIFFVIEGIPRSIGILQPLLLLIFISLSRLTFEFILNFNKRNNKKTKSNILIYGAGNAGHQVILGLKNNNIINVVGFVDDNVSLHKKKILNYKIFSPEKLEKLIKKYQINHVLVAIPSASIKIKKKILAKISKYKVTSSSLPSLNDLYQGKVDISDFKKFNINDLLERESVDAIPSLLKKNIFSKVVLVTGAGGSIGSELCRQIIKNQPKKLILIEINEYALYKIESELLNVLTKHKNAEQIKICSFLVSIQVKKKIDEIIKNLKPDTIYHSAAYKHVTIVEENICESLKNNIFGTLNLIKSSIDHKVSNFVLISSDKAVRPTNIMGASKRLAEICLQSICKSFNSSNTKFSAVRFGNVLISSGSVIPKFLDQIKFGGPITLTHQDVTRYFMTISEAAQLVIQAGAMCDQGDIFILDMGKPIKIRDLIINLIKMSGYSLMNESNPDGDIAIKVTGLRPGEKLHEELLIGQNPIQTNHPMIKKSQEKYIPWNNLESEIKNLEMLIENEDIDKIIEKIKNLIPDFNTTNRVSDNLYCFKKNHL